MRRDFADPPQTLVVAHPGAWGEAGQNTLEAFEAAIALGVELKEPGHGVLLLSTVPRALVGVVLAPLIAGLLDQLAGEQLAYLAVVVPGAALALWLLGHEAAGSDAAEDRELVLAGGC